MIVGIAKIGPGVVALEEFRSGMTSPTEAVSLFCSEHESPPPESDFLGIDTGWESVQRPADGYVWAWDFDSHSLVELASPSPEYRLSVEVVAIDPKVVDSQTWSAIGGVVLTPEIHGDLARISAAMTGEAMVIGSAELRVTETDHAGSVVDMTPTPLTVLDTGGAYQTWSLVTQVPPAAGQNTYRVEARAVGPTAQASVRFASMVLVIDN